MFKKLHNAAEKIHFFQPHNCCSPFLVTMTPVKIPQMFWKGIISLLQQMLQLM
jgi:hypothetical protein